MGNHSFACIKSQQREKVLKGGTTRGTTPKSSLSLQAELSVLSFSQRAVPATSGSVELRVPKVVGQFEFYDLRHKGVEVTHYRPGRPLKTLVQGHVPESSIAASIPLANAS